MEKKIVRSVCIPDRIEHEGFYWKLVTLRWICPVCGGPRGTPHKVRSYDGSQSMVVDGWTNPCGHVDKYSDVIKEYNERVLVRYPGCLYPDDEYVEIFEGK